MLFIKEIRPEQQKEKQRTNKQSRKREDVFTADHCYFTDSAKRSQQPGLRLFCLLGDFGVSKLSPLV